jgi:hypothetical protein
MKRKFLILLAILVVTCWAGVASADLIVTGSSGSLAASATFSFVGSNLQVVLANTSTADVLVPSNVLTAVFFNVAGNPTLGSVSAVLSAGSTVFFDSAPAGGVVGGEWAYGNSLAGAPGGANQGISSSGFGLFGAATFPGSGLDPPAAVDGLNYGITSANDNPATGNAAVTGGFPLIKNSVTFTLSGLPTGFNLADISNVSFQYGTALTEPNVQSVPIPPTALLLGSGLLGIIALGGRRRKK